MEPLQEINPNSAQEPSASQILALAEWAWLRRQFDVVELLVETAERQGTVTPKGLLLQAMSQLNLRKYDLFWPTLSRAKAMAPADEYISSVFERVANACCTYTFDSQPYKMEVRDAGEFLAQNPDRGKSVAICERKIGGVALPFHLNFLRDVFVVGSEGYIIDIASSSIFKNSFSSQSQKFVSFMSIAPNVTSELSNAAFVPGWTAHLCGKWSGNFFHWISEVLPRALLLKKSGFIGWHMVPCCLHPFILDSLEMIGVPRDRIINNHPRKAIRCESIATFDSLDFTTHYENPEIMQELRDCLLQQVDTSSPLPDNARGIYIMRRGKRCVHNHSEVRELLVSAGIYPIYAEDFSLKEQISLAARSRFICGPHGAGLTLALFMPPESTLVEFAPSSPANVCYDYVSSLLRHRHFFVPSTNIAAGNEAVAPSIAVLRQILKRELGCSV